MIRQVDWSCRKRAAVHIGLLAAMAAAMGLYHLRTTVVISPDGVLYVEMARDLLQGQAPRGPRVPPGYPAMVAAAGALVGLDGQDARRDWALTAQSVTLLCRVLSIVPLYLLYRRFIGGRGALAAMAIMLTLPRFAKHGADALRDWPFVLLFVSALAALSCAVRRGSLRWMLLAGLLAAGASLVRAEGVLLAALGLAWIAREGLARGGAWSGRRSAIAAGVLVGVFAAVAAAWLASTGYVPRNAGIVAEVLANRPADAAAPLTGLAGVADFFVRVVHKSLSGMMYIPLALLLAGWAHRFRQNADRHERFLMTALPVGWLAILAVRYACVGPEISTRYIMAPAMAMGFYVWAGVRLVTVTLDRALRKRLRLARWPGRLGLRGSAIATAALLIAAVPTLLLPVGHGKEVYRQAASYLRRHSPPDAMVASFDSRVWFYSERTMGDSRVGFDYSVRQFSGEDPHFVAANWKKVFDEPVYKSRDRLVVYQCPNSRPPQP